MTLSTESLVDSGASVNFIFTTFAQTLEIASLDLISSRVISADSSEISSAGNEFFYFLFIAVNEKTFSVHLFWVIHSLHQIILELLWLHAVNFTIDWCIKKILIKNQVEMISAAHFLEEAEDNLIYVYYTDFDRSEPSSEISVVYQTFSDVFKEKAENILPSH